jgi:uncharacterized MAPEG superfamily protein
MTFPIPVTLAHVCIVVACVLPIVCAGIAKGGKFGQPRAKGGYDNHDPRAWLAKQEGYRARAANAMANSFEALPLFIAGVLIAQITGARLGLVDALAVAFVLLRVAYIAAYVADRANLRSLVWLLALLVAAVLPFTSLF